MSRLSLKAKAEAAPEPVTDAHMEAAVTLGHASEEPIAVTMAGSPPSQSSETSVESDGGIEDDKPSCSTGPAATSPQTRSGRAQRSTRRKSAGPVAIDTFSDEDILDEVPGEHEVSR